MNTKLSLIIVISFNLIASNCYTVKPGPLVIATEGEVWPKPYKRIYSDSFHLINPSDFSFNIVSESCNILTGAISRYKNIIANQTFPHTRKQVKNEEQISSWKKSNFVGYLESLDVILMEPCNDDEIPTISMLEQYEIKIAENASVLAATSVWGILRGLETFSQLLYPAEGHALILNCTFISDFPRYSHRGVLIDTSRHFIPVQKLLKILDALAYNKLNVFHWHITDDQSFPYQSRDFPSLSEKGSYLPTHVYSQSDVAMLIKYAAARGIRVVAEFDTPGHTRCWGNAFPQLLTECYSNGVPTGEYGPMDPTKEFTYKFMKQFLSEVVDVFYDRALHLGGDEVDYDCWATNPDIKHFMEANNISSYKKLEGYYIKKLIDISEKLKMNAIVWEEVFTNVADIPENTIVHVWKEGWRNTIKEVTRRGFNTLLSSCWYLDHLYTGGDWIKFYNCEPTDFKGTEKQKKLVMGGEACMWAEVVNEYNLESRIWPRASATAEKLWSEEDADEIDSVKRRLEEHTCRMNKRGVQAQPPNGAGFCEM
ncbi:hypothetical protein PPYR_00153 [Photinus pyralis]|uniref:Beta-hexosaminidase n=2 Tax=Photinus pyralis TaxID=7054 RepID=A0A5N4B0V3_PHOPY|nr:beta-hexosaminidase subunit beta-like [Photinus pyralis]XP_031338916.1 beta-hexosaminidase subunit beta-like [Photinus pyralis]KAB0803183.1 hypothetical protein PPYR_00153 [Photinus pyralis]